MLNRTERNIIKEILRECYPKKLVPNEDFVTYVVKLYLLNPNWGITENLLESRANVQKLVKFVISQLESKSVKMMTLKMQFYYIWSVENVADDYTRNRVSLANRLSPLKEQICKMDIPANDNEMDNLKRFIVVYVIFSSGLGNPLKQNVYLDGLYALKSVMNEEELKEFCAYSKEQKEMQLEELTKILSGIRLFNKYCEKGGAGIPNLIETFKTAVVIVKEEMQLLLVRILEKVKILTNVYEKCYVLRKTAINYYLECVTPPHINMEHIEIGKDQLIHFRQYELFVRNIIQCVDALREKTNRIEVEIQSLTEHIVRVVGSKLAVPVVVIFPLFNQLANLWTGVQQQVISLSRYSKIVSKLAGYCKNLHFNKTLFDELLNFDPTVGDDKFLQEHSDCCLASRNQIKIITFEEENVELQYLGFCCFKLVETNGALIPGNTTLGVAHYNKKYYAFSSLQAYQSFSKKPEEYILRVQHIARKKPQIINFLLLHDELTASSHVKRLVVEPQEIKKTRNKAVQSDNTYVVPPYKDISQKWNVWDIKREVLATCNLTKCKTTSTQTLKTFSTNSVKVMTVQRKDTYTETCVDKYTSVPTQSTFIFGLRGRKDDKQFVLDLTRPVEE